MSATRPPAVGRTRTCPHCKSTILESSAVCPACRHHLKFNRDAQAAALPDATVFRVQGSIANPEPGTHSEYTLVVAVSDERGQEIARHVINVGALGPGEKRTCVVSFDLRRPA